MLVAPDLLGAILVDDAPDGVVAARLVEVEAYAGPEDRASHARAGRTSRTDPMFGPPGSAYVFLVYGLHHCLNVVTGGAGEAGAVLLRAAAPFVGLGLMRARRGGVAGPAHRLASGPGRLGAAFAIVRAMNGADLTAGRLRLLPPAALEGRHGEAEGGPDGPGGVWRDEIIAGPRIGVAYAGEPWVSLPWRFHIAGDPSVSR